HIVIGEAEEIILDIINGRYSEQIIHGRPVKNLDELPFINYDLLVNAKHMNIIPIMTSRGCPFNCNFCTVTKVFGRAFRQQSADRIISEIKHAKQYFNKSTFFFYDDNFTTNKQFSNDIINRFIKEKLNITWTAQVRADIANDDALLHKIFKAGCDRVFIGFESIDERVLKSYGKSQTRHDIEKAIKKIHECGINIHGMFMVGEDNDIFESIDITVDFAIENHIDTVQFMILTPFPGTQIYEKLNSENRLLHHNWDFFNGMHVVHYPKSISPLQLQLGVINAHRKFYSVSRTLLDLLYFIFNITSDALVWNFSRAKRYDLNNLYLKAGAKLIIIEYIRSHNNYIDYLQNSFN
ncbi:MAG: radical SAM protein, partial [Elusimicrobia bacterium]|nr:radical SAM protein [Elusimicrobiota bacterium]MBD3412065.1 radical SAM protein [Elusimicrobiota bacterium]